MHNVLKATLLAAVMAGSTGAAYALPITYNFTSTGFKSADGNPLPHESIAGSFTLDGNTLTQINLTLGSHSFTALEAAFNNSSDFPTLAGLIDGDVNSLAWGVNDFWLMWTNVEGTPSFFEFAYSTDSVEDFYRSSSGTIEVAPVPIPASAWLLGSGLAGLIGVSRKRRAS